MPGGLELAALPDETGTGGGGGGLSGLSSGADMEGAILRLRESARGLMPDAIDQFAQRANGAYPTWKEIQSRIETELSNQERAGERTMSDLRNPPINRGLPWLRFAAGMMSPTKTGAFGESLGHGIGEYAAGASDVNKQELDFSRRAAETGYGISKDRVAGVEGMYKLGQSSQKLDLALAMMRQRLTQAQLTPAMREWAVKNGIDLQDPEWQRKLTPELRKDLEKFVLLARGTPQMKNSQAMLDPSDPQFANMVRLLNNEKVKIQAMKMAEARHPMSAYQGQDVGVRNAAVNAELLQILRDHALGRTLGTPIGDELKRAEGAVPGAPAAGTPPAGPAGAPAVSAPDAAAPAAEPHPFDAFMTPPKFQPNVPGQIQSEQQEAQQKTAAAEAEKRASSYLEKEVYPGIKAADDMRSSAIIARQLLDKDPQLTGALKPFAGEIANIMTTLGIAPKRAEQFATNMELFKSQAMLQVLAKQLEQKGVQTESDALRIMQAGIDPKKPAEANRFMVRYMEAVANRLQERASFFDRWAKRNGAQLGGSVEAWSSYSKKFPMALVLDGKVHFRDIQLPE